MYCNLSSIYLCAAAGVGLLALFRTARARQSKLRRNHPPIIDIPISEIFNNPREAYERALREHGPVIALEFIVDDTLIPMLFTSDEAFSFEEAMATVLNLRPFVSFFWSFFREIDDLVQNGINPMLETILERMCKVFIASAETARDEENLDMFEYVHTSIGEAMISVIFGEGYANERNIKSVTAVATDIAGLTGMYQNSSFLGRPVICTTILAFFRVMGPQVWQHVRVRRKEADEKPTNLLEMVASASGGFLWIMSMLLGASVAVWVMFEIALRPEYLARIREEALNHVDPLTHELDPSNIGEAVQKAVWLDSFIREVLRTKGDTLSTCRRTTADTDIGGRTIPKGHLVFPLATLAHFNPKYHPDPNTFKPERWHAPNNRPAVMSSASYIAFGMGRWACPGRVLAVSEIKMIVWSLIVKATPHLDGNTYKIVDPLNVTSIPPEGKLKLERYSA
ncbi:cytochrome P450 [Mycena amicta]|nr:cytochrome P450 [Mycena amicta]